MVDLSGVEQNRHPSLVERAKAILLTPRDEWTRIAGETTPQAQVLTGYVLPLAAIGPLASLIGGQVFGYGAFGISYRPGLVWSLGSAVISYVVTIIGVFVLALIADFLAPKFGGVASRSAAFRMVAYGATASWLAGVFGLIPSLAFFSLLGLYSLYLFYTGATPVMKVPQDKAAGYTAVTVLCAIVLALVVAPVSAAITGLFAASPVTTPGGELSGKVTLPGGQTIDLEKADQLGKQLEQAGKTPAVEPARLQALLPAAVGAYQRTATENLAVGAMGSTAQGTYAAGDRSFTLRIADMSAVGALAGMGAAMGVEQSREDADGYEKTGVVDGQMQMESWNRTSGSGKFGMMVENRFLVEAEGQAASIDELRQAVAAIDRGDLTDLAE
jgi:hypothetical protein